MDKLSFHNSNSLVGRVANAALKFAPPFPIGPAERQPSAMEKTGVEYRGAFQPANDIPGTLYVNDTFTPSFANWSDINDVTHGVMVAESARQLGFSGPLLGQESSVPGYGQGLPEWASKVSTPSESAREARGKLESYAAGQACSLLERSTEYLNGLTKHGVKDSAVNISYGLNVAKSANSLYDQLSPAMRAAPEDRNPGLLDSRGLLDNAIQAFGLDETKLRSADREVRDIEQAKLLQGLLDASEAAYSGSAVQADRKLYNQAVKTFEAGHNSVVVSAGNQGEDMHLIRGLVPTQKLREPGNMTENVLENNDVTLVGSTEHAPGQLFTRRAAYTSPSAEIDIYAPGWLESSRLGVKDVEGTSFAAPRVAALMAEIHRRNPGISSVKAEGLLMQQLSHTVEDQSGAYPTLDLERTQRFLADRTF